MIRTDVAPERLFLDRKPWAVTKLVRSRSSKRNDEVALHAPTPQHDDPVGEEECFLNVVRNEDSRLPLRLPDRREFLLQQAFRDVIKGAKWLVEEQDLGTVYEDGRERHPLLHAPRELVWVIVLETVEPNQPQILTGEFPTLVLWDFADREAVFDVADNGSPGKDCILLEDDATLTSRAVNNRSTGDDLASRGRLQTGDELEQRSLSRPRGAYDGCERVGGDREIDVIDRD